MSLPTSEVISPDELDGGIPPSPRRRRRRVIIPGEINERTVFIQELAQRVFPTLDFYISSILAAMMLAVALLMDSPALFILAALLSPFMAPVIGLSISTIVSSFGYFFQSLAGMAVGGVLAFLGGLLAGWIGQFVTAPSPVQASYFTHFSWPNFVVLALGAGLSSFLLARSPRQRPVAASMALAYELFPPAAAAGYGLFTGNSDLWPGGAVVFAVHLLWAMLIGSLMLGILELRPLRWVGYVLGILAFIGSMTAAYAISGFSFQLPQITLPPAPTHTEKTLPAALSLTYTPVPSSTVTPTSITPVSAITRTPTNTLVPTATPTFTVSPMPTPVWARVNSPEGSGAYLREEPNFNANVITTLLNGTLIQVLPEVVTSGGVVWAHVHTTDGKEGWIVRNLLMTATPAPGW